VVGWGEICGPGDGNFMGPWSRLTLRRLELYLAIFASDGAKKKLANCQLLLYLPWRVAIIPF
jgi:hypothetical protein